MVERGNLGPFFVHFVLWSALCRRHLLALGDAPLSEIPLVSVSHLLQALV